MKKKIILFAACVLLILAAVFKLNIPRVNTSYNDSDNNSKAINELIFGKITDKNIDIANKKVNPYFVDKKDMDPFWKDHFHLIDVEVENEWIYPASVEFGEPSEVAIFGALESDPKQGLVITFSVDSKYVVSGMEQFLAPFKGGALSVINEQMPKDFVMEAQDETGRIYAFNYSNGFDSYKNNADDDWIYIHSSKT